jgi:hypothetical protein
MHIGINVVSFTVRIGFSHFYKTKIGEIVIQLKFSPHRSIQWSQVYMDKKEPLQLFYIMYLQS